MKKKIAALVVLVLAAAAGYYLTTQNKANPNELTLYGNIEIRQVDLSFQVPGQIARLVKEEGDHVTAGELLAELDCKDYEMTYKKADADVDRTLAKSRDAADKYARYAPLSGDNTVSKQDVDSLYNAKNIAEAEYNAALANRDYIKNQLDYTRLYAPEDGIIMIRVQEPGATVAKGQAVYTMAKTSPLWVRAYVNETALGNIQYGQKVQVYTDTVNPQTNKKRTYNGQIGFISPVAEFTPKTVQSTDTRTDLVYRIRVYVDDTDGFLKQGMPVTIVVDLRSHQS